MVHHACMCVQSANPIMLLLNACSGCMHCSRVGRRGGGGGMSKDRHLHHLIWANLTVALDHDSQSWPASGAGNHTSSSNPGYQTVSHAHTCKLAVHIETDYVTNSRGGGGKKSSWCLCHGHVKTKDIFAKLIYNVYPGFHAKKCWCGITKQERWSRMNMEHSGIPTFSASTV